MLQPIPESVPTSRDSRSKRPLKRQALTPTSEQATQLDALFAKPDREIVLPPSSSTALSRKSGLPPPPEIVANVQGSSAGAGSGEFHVYKASRRREYERVKIMDEEVAREQANEEFEKKREEQRKKDEEKTEKNRKKRERTRTQKSGKSGKDKSEAIPEVVMGNRASRKTQTDIRVQPEQQPDIEGADGAGLPASTEEVGVIIHEDD